MNTTFYIATTLLLIAAAFFALPKIRELIRPVGEYFANVVTIKAVNILADGRATFIADNAFTSRYLIAKPGSDGNHMDICTATDIPLGVVPDMTPSSGDLTLPLPCNLFTNAANETVRMIASAAVSVGNFVVPDAAGQVKALPGASGTYYVIGKALTAALAAGDMIHVAPLFYKDRVP